MSGSGGASSGGGATGKGGTTGLGGANGSGGASGSGDSGAGGNATGGTTANTGGKVGATGGTTTSGTGGGQTGGTQSTGGATSPGAGGTSAASTALVTSASGAYWKTATWTEVTSGTADVTVNDTSASQTWEGFGGAFNEKGWSYLTTKDMQDQAMQLLFGTDGAHFAWGRIPIGASDYAMDRYTLDETANDTSMASFSIDRDQQKLIPYIKAAQAVKSDIRFWASPWTPPTWMKTGPYNPNTGKSNSNFDGGVMKSDDATLKAYGQYLVKFVQAYADQGINVEIVSPQNEPNYQQNYPSCHWETATYVKFVGSYLGPALAAANLTTKIMDGTLSNPSGDADIGSSVLKDSTAKGYCKAIGVQWGMAATNQITTLKDLAGDISIWLSETQCGGTTGSTAPAPNDFSYGHDTWGYITSAIKNGLTAYNAWNMVLDKGGLGIDDTRKWPQNALLVADSGSITQTPAYYVFRHISQFVDPGAKVVGTTGGDAVAFKNPDGTLVAVMYNSGSAKSTFTVAMGGKKLQFSMPASGWATVKNE
jgi:glucosylceramidase